MTEPSQRAWTLAEDVTIACKGGRRDYAAQLIEDALAMAWDAGHRASERDFEFIWDLATPDEDRHPWTNPYRQEKS